MIFNRVHSSIFVVFEPEDDCSLLLCSPPTRYWQLLSRYSYTIMSTQHTDSDTIQYSSLLRAMPGNSTDGSGTNFSSFYHFGDCVAIVDWVPRNFPCSRLVKSGEVTLPDWRGVDCSSQDGRLVISRGNVGAQLWSELRCNLTAASAWCTVSSVEEK
jgi:hypothetical protein